MIQPVSLNPNSTTKTPLDVHNVWISKYILMHFIKKESQRCKGEVNRLRTKLQKQALSSNWLSEKSPNIEVIRFFPLAVYIILTHRSLVSFWLPKYAANSGSYWSCKTSAQCSLEIPGNSTVVPPLINSHKVEKVELEWCIGIFFHYRPYKF